MATKVVKSCSSEGHFLVPIHLFKPFCHNVGLQRHGPPQTDDDINRVNDINMPNSRAKIIRKFLLSSWLTELVFGSFGRKAIAFTKCCMAISFTVR